MSKLNAKSILKYTIVVFLFLVISNCTPKEETTTEQTDTLKVDSVEVVQDTVETVADTLNQ